jgi:hypothetical protein
MVTLPRSARAQLRRGVAVLSIALVGLGLVGLGACSGGRRPGAARPTPSSTQSGAASRVTHLLTVGSTDVQRAGSRGAVSDATRRSVLASAQRYVDRAVLAPLETGNVGRGYAALFVAGIRPAAVGPDVGALTDRAIGETTTLTEQSTPVALSALADKSGALLYLATRFNVQVKATGPRGQVSINRSVELTYEHVGATWLVAAYRIKVTRRTPTRATAGSAGAANRSTAAVAFRAGDAS